MVMTVWKYCRLAEHFLMTPLQHSVRGATEIQAHMSWVLRPAFKEPVGTLLWVLGMVHSGFCFCCSVSSCGYTEPFIFSWLCIYFQVMLAVFHILCLFYSSSRRQLTLRSACQPFNIELLIFIQMEGMAFLLTCFSWAPVVCHTYC